MQECLNARPLEFHRALKAAEWEVTGEPHHQGATPPPLLPEAGGLLDHSGITGDAEGAPASLRRNARLSGATSRFPLHLPLGLVFDVTGPYLLAAASLGSAKPLDEIARRCEVMKYGAADSEEILGIVICLLSK